MQCLFLLFYIRVQSWTGPIGGMLLAPKEAQACAYLFQKRNDNLLIIEPMTRARHLIAFMTYLQGLVSNRPISDMVLLG